MKGVYFGFFLVLGTLNVGLSQTITSAQDGAWNQISTWVGGTIPTSSNSTSIVIQHNVNVPSGFSVTVDQVTVDINAVLTIDAGGSVTVADDGTIATDLDCFNDGIDYGYLTVNGTLINSNSALITGTDQGNTSFNSGSVYRHLYTTSEGVLPIANWDSNSTIQIQGYTTSITATASGNWGQNFGNFTFNCTSLGSGVIQMQGLLINVNDLTVSSTGATGSFRLATTQNPPITIARDLIISGSSRVIFNTTGASTLIDIGRDFIYNSTNTSGSTTNSTGNTTFTVGRDFSMSASGGQLILASGAGAGNGIFNITGNFTLTAGTITETSSSTGVGNINFLAGSHTFSNTGTISNSINFTVNNSATLTLGTSAIAGGGTFTLGPSAVLQVGSIDAAGAIQTGFSAGNIRNSGSRTYDASSTIVYNGTGAQKIGSGFPTNVNLEINNSTGVTNNNVGVTNVIGNLTLTSGPFYIGSSNTLNVQSNFFVTSGTIGGSSTSNLTFSGSGTLSTLSFFAGSETLNNLTLTRITNLTLGSNLTIGGVLDLSGGNLDFSGKTLTINGGSITSSGTGLKSNALSTLAFGGSTFSGSVPFSGSGNQLNNLTFGTGGGAYTWSSGVTINGTLTLSAGALTHSSGITMAANSTFVKGSGTISGSAPTAASGGYNVTYIGTGNTGLELPTNSTGLKNLSVNASGGTVTLLSGVTINGNFDVSNGTFAVGSNSVTMKGSTWSSSGGTFSAGTGTVTFSGAATALSGLTTFKNISVSGVVTLSSATTTVNGNIVNIGTINSGAGLVVFAGTTAITGAGTTSFNDLTISGALTAPSGTMNVSGDFTNNGTFIHNNGSVVFNGTTLFAGTTPSFNNVSISGTLTAPATFNIAGNLSNSGTFNNNSGTIVMNGTVGVQNMTGTFSVNNMNVSNANGVNNNGTINLSGALTLVSSGKFDADGSSDTGFLIVKSTGVASGGRIAALPDITKFTGKITVERFIDGNKTYYWRMLSMPITDGTAATWKANFPVTGSFSDASPNGVNNVDDRTAPSIYYYDVAGQALTPVTGATTGGTLLTNTRGYYVYPYFTNDFTASVRGNPAKGDVTSTLSATNGSYAIVGNPYASPIDWDNVTLGSTIDDYMSLMNANQVLSWYQQSTGMTLNPPTAQWTGEVAIGQSFWIQSRGATSFTFKETHKAATANNNYYFLREKQTDNYFKITLSSKSQSDQAAIRFADGATIGEDPSFDAGKIKNGMIPGQKVAKYLNLSTTNEGGRQLAINAVPPITCNTSIKLNVDDVLPGTHTLSFTELERMKLGYTIVLVDKYSKSEQFVTSDFVYQFDVSTDSASFGVDRFELRFLVKGSAYLSSVVAPATSITNECLPGILPVKVKAISRVSYQLFVGENPVSEAKSLKSDGIIEFEISKDKLALGENIFAIQATTGLGCESFHYPAVFKYSYTTIEPVSIEKTGSILLTNFDSNNKWFKDDVALAETGKQVIVTEPGVYTVQRYSGACLMTSEKLEVTDEQLSSELLQAFPNPTKNKISFILPSDVQNSLKSIVFYDVKGVRIADELSNPELLTSSVKTLDVSTQKPGIYIVKIVSNRIHHLKFVKE
jgi:hypothetical protein